MKADALSKEVYDMPKKRKKQFRLKTKIGCLGYLTLGAFLFLLLLNLNYYKSDGFKVQAFGEKHSGIVTQIDSTKANYQNYRFTYTIVDNNFAGNRVEISEVKKKPSVNIFEKIDFKSLGHQYEFTFSIFDFIIMILFGSFLVASANFFILAYQNAD